MPTIASLRQSHTCTRCREELIAPERSLYLSEDTVANIWVCRHCGYEFETSMNLHPSLTPEVIGKYFPSLLIG